MTTEFYTQLPRVYALVQWTGDNLAEMSDWFVQYWRNDQSDALTTDENGNLLVRNREDPELFDYVVPLDGRIGTEEGSIWDNDNGSVPGFQRIPGTGPFEYQIGSAGS